MSTSTVILISIDGLRPDCIRPDRFPHLSAVQSRGAWTMSARSVMPSITLPCHTSIFHSVPPERHGILTNDWHPMARPVPGLVESVHQHELRCTFFYNWENLRDLSPPGRLEHSYFLNTAEVYPPDPEGDHKIAAAANAYIRSAAPDFAFVYFGTLDVYGHLLGWMSDGYLEHCTRVDAALGLLLDGLPPNVMLMIVSDHGGHDRIHGTDLPEDMTVPWLIAGPGIKTGHAIQRPVSLLDTAPTLAHLLGIKAPKVWEGHCIAEIFV